MSRTERLRNAVTPLTVLAALLFTWLTTSFYTAAIIAILLIPAVPAYVVISAVCWRIPLRTRGAI